MNIIKRLSFLNLMALWFLFFLSMLTNHISGDKGWAHTISPQNTDCVQLAAVDPHEGHQHIHETEGDVEIGALLGRLIRPFGVTTFSLLVITAYLGLRRPKTKLIMRLHKIFAFITLFVAASHGTIAFLLG